MNPRAHSSHTAPDPAESVLHLRQLSNSSHRAQVVPDNQYPSTHLEHPAALHSRHPGTSVQLKHD